MINKTCIINSDEYTGGKDEVWSVYKPYDPVSIAVCNWDLISGTKRISFSGYISDIAPLDNAEVIMANYDKPDTYLGKLRQITIKQAEDHPFIIKFGDQANARYYGVFEE